MASASGSIGNLTFRFTRQGQVVQQKSNPAQPQTPGMIATNDAFRRAMNNFKRLPSDLRLRIGRGAAWQGQTVMQAWVGAYYRLYRYHTWDMDVSDGETPRLILASVDFAPPVMRFLTNLDTAPGTYHAYILRTWMGRVVGTPPGFDNYPLTIPPSDLPYNPLFPDFTYLLFPFYPGSQNSIGRPDAYIGLSP